jgi:hypothetical protein
LPSLRFYRWWVQEPVHIRSVAQPAGLPFNQRIQNIKKNKQHGSEKGRKKKKDFLHEASWEFKHLEASLSDRVKFGDN